MLRLIIKGLLWQMLLLASLGWLITGCDKEGAADIEPFQDQLVENASIEMIDGRLLFNNKAHFDQTLARMAKSETVDLPERFISYYETYNSIVNNDMSDEQFINFVESPEFQRYFRVLEDQEGLKSMEPIWSSKLFGQVLSKNLEIQIGTDVIRYDGDNGYRIDASRYSEEDFKSLAKETFPIERNVISEDFSRDEDLDDCTEFFGMKNGSWQNKMQGKILYNGDPVFKEYTIETRSRKRSTFGWWVSNNK